MKTIDERIWDDNLRMRKEYIADSSFSEVDEFDPNQLKLWRKNKLLFSVSDQQGNELFPSFQFENEKPLEVISRVLKRFPDDMTPWQTAFWFSTFNGYLDGKIPQECLNDIDGLLFAAEEEAAKIFG